MKTEQITLDELVEIAVILNKVDESEKDKILTYVINLNNAVIDYENRIKNAIHNLAD